MARKETRWCFDCRWISTRVQIDGGSAYWCESAAAPIEGSVVFRPACDRFSPRSAIRRP